MQCCRALLSPLRISKTFLPEHQNLVCTQGKQQIGAWKKNYLFNLRRNLHIETASALNRLTFVVLLVHKSYIICVGEIIPVIEFFSPAVSGPESLIIESDWLIARALAARALPSGPRLTDCLAQELLKRFLFEHKVTLMKGLTL